MRATLSKALTVCLALMLPPGAARAGDDGAKGAIAWPDSLLSRAEALALLQTLNSDLLSHDSATLTLDRWCDAHHLASPARIIAERVRGAEKEPQRSSVSNWQWAPPTSFAIAACACTAVGMFYQRPTIGTCPAA
jgi:hypothetical protein